MNYAGHEKLRAEVAEVANAMCDLRTTMNEMEQRYSFNADTLPERLVRQTLFRANRLLMEAYIRPRSRQWWQLFRMVSQWHVDVVIVERRSFSIVAAVELDDASHLRPERRRRDILLEEVLRQAGIPLLRSHDARKLLQMTGEWLNTTGAAQQSPEHRS